MNDFIILQETSIAPKRMPSFVPLAYDAIARLDVKLEEAKRMKLNTDEVPLWEKYALSIEEAAALFGVGEKRIRQICSEHPNGDFFMEVGSHVKIKRKKFVEYLDGLCAV